MIVHVSAEALGSEAIANTTSIAPASASTLHSFHLPSNVALVLHIIAFCAGQSDADHMRRRNHATNWSGALQC